MDTTLIARINGYLDSAPLAEAWVDLLGPLRLFVSTGPWPYYGRPISGDFRVQAKDLRRFETRCHELRIEPRVEWLDLISPEMEELVNSCGWSLHRYPLLASSPIRSSQSISPTVALAAPRLSTAPAPLAGHATALVQGEPHLQAEARAIAEISFAGSDQDLGSDDRGLVMTVAGRLDQDTVSWLIGRFDQGLTYTVVAGPRGGHWVSTGQHQPLGGVSEVVGLATLPAWRRKGMASSVIAALRAHAASLDVDLLFLSAESDSVAMLYRKSGFNDVCCLYAAGPASEA